MSDFSIRNPKKSDEKDLIEVVHKTGFFGKDLAGRKLFDDKKLWAYLWLLHYIRYERENCFVVFDGKKRKTVGYVIGTADTSGYLKRFKKDMKNRIKFRVCCYTSWRYPRTLKTFIKIMKSSGENGDYADGFSIEYPAHFHMNLLPGYQGRGLGSKLLNRFEEKMRKDGIRGINIGTTSLNEKALPFYKKHGYKICFETPTKWLGIYGKECMFYRMIKKL